MATTPIVDSSNEPSQARAACLARHRPPPLASSRPVEREPKEVEGRPTFPAPLPLRRTPERKKARLVGMQGQSEVLHSLAEGIHHALRIFFVFEADDEVIGVPDQSSLATELRFDPPLEPTIEYVVQIDVSQQW